MIALNHGNPAAIDERMLDLELALEVVEDHCAL
jgi:hypothetical protein